MCETARVIVSRNSPLTLPLRLHQHVEISWQIRARQLRTIALLHAHLAPRQCITHLSIARLCKFVTHARAPLSLCDPPGQRTLWRQRKGCAKLHTSSRTQGAALGLNITFRVGVREVRTHARTLLARMVENIVWPLSTLVYRRLNSSRA